MWGFPMVNGFLGQGHDNKGNCHEKQTGTDFSQGCQLDDFFCLRINEKGEGGNKDKDQNEDKKDQDQDKNEKNDDQSKKNKEPSKQDISPQQLKNILEAMSKEEKKVQEKINKKKFKGNPKSNKKDW